MITKFYNELEKENKVEILKPDTTLIKSVIEENTATKTEQAKADNVKKAEVATSAPSANKKPANAVKTPAKKPAAQAKKPEKAKQGQQVENAQPAKKTGETRNQDTNTRNNSGSKSTFTSSRGSSTNTQQEIADNVADNLFGDEGTMFRELSKKDKEDIPVYSNSEELVK